MHLVIVDYTIQGVWALCNSQVTFIMDRKTRIAIGGEDMLQRVAIR
jgi:hypothetical protein